MVRKEQSRLVRVRDAEILATMVEDRGWTLRPLSDEVQRELRKRRQPTIGASKATLGNLISGERDVVRAPVARALAAVLRMRSWDSLFADDLCTVAREVDPRSAA